MQQSINERFKIVVNEYIKKELGINKTHLANALGVKSSLFSEILNFRTNLSLEMASKFLTLYPMVSTDWLLFGTGDMLHKKNDDATNISKHDLEILNKEYGFFPDLDIVKSYLMLSDSRLKNMLSNLKKEMEQKIETNNNICQIAEELFLNKDTYYKNRFEKISEKDYMKKVIQDFNPSTTSFENVKLKWITLIYQFESSNEDLSFITANMIRYLKMGINSRLNLGFLKINHDLINKLSDLE